MGETHCEPAGWRFLFWAAYYGGDPQERDKLQWVTFEIPGFCHGGYMRHEDATVGVLRRYDREASDRGIHPAGTALDEKDGAWRESEGAYRNYHRGGDYGEPITTAQATEIVIELGYPPEILTADPV